LRLTVIGPVKAAVKVNTRLYPDITTDTILELTSVPVEEYAFTKETDVGTDANATEAVREAPSPTMVSTKGIEAMFAMWNPYILG
jgi:hypothetical protein